MEINDLNVTRDQYTDCRGDFNGTGPCSAKEDIFGQKAGGSQFEPELIMHNRAWGARKSDQNFTLAGSDGWAFTLAGTPLGAEHNSQTGTKYALVKNNIAMDSQGAFGDYWTELHHHSYVGNIAYDIQPYHSTTPSYSFSTNFINNSEFYLNTIIGLDNWFNFGGGTPTDVKCNVILESGFGGNYTGSQDQVSYNAFYKTPSFSTASPNEDIVLGSATQSSNTEYCFYRKLLTNPEQVCIPYAKTTTASPHYSQCSAGAGQRAGIGINDKIWTWADTLFNF